jgi:hypothetical protein
VHLAARSKHLVGTIAVDLQHAAEPGEMGNRPVSCVKIAETDPDGAPALLARAIAFAKELEDAGRLAPVDAWVPADLARRLAQLAPAKP